MILVDKTIKDFATRGLLISKGYAPSNVNSISYDLTLGEFLEPDKESIDVMPGEFLIVKTAEELNIPKDITGRIGEKNSLLRLGLKVDGPQYQPGHVTFAFLRVQNLSGDVITLHQNMKIAQIYFEQLECIPDTTYDQQRNASFHQEDEYRGYGKYDTEYRKNLKSFTKIKDDIEHMSTRIYGNVLTLMGIIVAIFSLLSINYQAFTQSNLSSNYIIAMNLSLTFCIAVMLGMVLFLVNGWGKKWFSILYILILLALGVVVFMFCMIPHSPA